MPLLLSIAKTAITLFLAYWLSSYFYSDSYWLILGTAFGLYLQQSYFLKRNWIVAKVALVAILLVFISSIFSSSLLLQMIFLFTVAVFSLRQGWQQRIEWPQVFAIIFLTSLNYFVVTNFAGALVRCYQLLLGFGLVVAINLIFMPAPKHKTLKELTRAILKCSQDLSDDIFLIYLRKDYYENEFLYEQLLHEDREDYLNAIQNLRDFSLGLTEGSLKIKAQKLLEQFTDLYDLLLSLLSLAYRVKDHTSFELVQPELKTLSQEIHSNLAHFSESHVQNFSKALSALEATYENTLRVAVQEPWAVSLFINDLKELNKLFGELSVDFQHV